MDYAFGTMFVAASFLCFFTAFITGIRRYVEGYGDTRLTWAAAIALPIFIGLSVGFFNHWR